MTDPQTAEVAVDAVTGLVNMFKDAKTLYWIITLYSLVVGAAMTYVGRRYFKSLIFLVGFFFGYLPAHYFAAETTSLICGAVAGLAMVFLYPIFVFLMGITILVVICMALGIDIETMNHTLCGVLGLIFGVGAVIFRKHIVIPVTAWSGSWMLALGLAFVFGGIHPYLFLLLGFLFIGSGIFVQYKYTAKGLKEVTKAVADKK